MYKINHGETKVKEYFLRFINRIESKDLCLLFPGHMFRMDTLNLCILVRSFFFLFITINHREFAALCSFPLCLRSNSSAFSKVKSLKGKYDNKTNAFLSSQFGSIVVFPVCFFFPLAQFRKKKIIWTYNRTFCGN